jgi:ribosome-binding factor A
MRPRPPRRGSAAIHVDPRSRKLSSQSLEALALALSGAGDPRLREASIVEVCPHPDATCLLVVVAAPPDAIDAVHAALEDARTWLRRELAAEIHRKRAPELAFAVVPVPEGTA